MKILSILLFFFFGILYYSASQDTISVDINGNSATVWHKHIFANCGSKFLVEITFDTTYIVITEIDTSTQWARCNCYFDLSTTFNYMDAGDYKVDIYRKETKPMYPIDTTYFVSSKSFHINFGPMPVSSIIFKQSECLGNIEFVNSNEGYTTENAYPNPANSILNFSFNSLQNCKGILKGYNIFGIEIIAPQNIEISEGINKISVSTENLAPGNHYFKLIIGEKIIVFPGIIVAR